MKKYRFTPCFKRKLSTLPEGAMDIVSGFLVALAILVMVTLVL
ncbi:MAG: hypothetical protein U9N61_10410 [Euryarchaeota archaeon]|nr:hypothetical protein [Euryarchaeota archaeon]